MPSPVLSMPHIALPQGFTPEALWAWMASGQPPSWACGGKPRGPASGTWPWPCAALLPDPPAEATGLNRKQLRLTEKSMRLTLSVARRAHALQARAPGGSETVGLFMGLPSIEDAAPSWDVLQAMCADQAPESAMADYVLRTSEPAIALVRLNSTLCAHLCESLRLQGAPAAFSPGSDAGLHALIEGVLSILEGDNEAAWIGATSAPVNETLALQWLAQDLGRHAPWPTEAAGLLYAQARPAAAAAVAPCLILAGHGRCHAPDQPALALQQALAQALARSGRREAGWLLVDQALADGTAPPALPLFPWLGHLGPAYGMAAVALAAQALLRQQRLCPGWRGPSPVLHALDTPLDCVAVAACHPRGSATVALLALDTPG